MATGNGAGKTTMKRRLFLFDLDGTLLRTDKTISDETQRILGEVRDSGNLIGVSTSRGEQNCKSLLGRLNPDILVASGGALVKKNDEYIFKAAFTKERTAELIEAARRMCGDDCEITVDTSDRHYWNYKTDPKKLDQSWGDSIWTDFRNFSEEALKICVEILDAAKAEQLANELPDCDAARFSDGFWYKFTPRGVTKEACLQIICEACGITTYDIIAFGDDYSDIGMLRMAGCGVAMGNSIDAVKAAADVVIGTNDEDGIAHYLKTIRQEPIHNLICE